MELLLFGGPIFDSEDGVLRHDEAILIKDAHIQKVGPQATLEETAKDAQRIDVKGRTILPGLIDAHRHMVGQSGVEATQELVASGVIFGVRVAQETLEAGITSVRDAGCKHNGIFELRRAINDGSIPGPTVYAAARNPTGNAAPQSWRNSYVSGPWSMRNAVRELYRDGADWVKVVANQATIESGWREYIRYLTDEEIRAAVEEAHALKMRISFHVEGLDTAKAVIAAGADAIEHGTVIDREAAALMAERAMTYVPTLWLFSTQNTWAPVSPHQEVALQARIEEHWRSVERAVEAGVKLAVGTDWIGPVPPHDCLISEMEYLMQHGLDASSAIKAATAGGAFVMGKIDEVGRIDEGLFADVIAVDGDPLQDIRALVNVDLVIKHGKVVKNQI